jgi:hypothetical protein
VGNLPSNVYKGNTYWISLGKLKIKRPIERTRHRRAKIQLTRTQEPVARSCEHDNKTSGCNKMSGIID